MSDEEPDAVCNSTTHLLPHNPNLPKEFHDLLVIHTTGRNPDLVLLELKKNFLKENFRVLRETKILICRVCRTFFWMSQLIFCRDIPDLGIFSPNGFLVSTLRWSDSDFEGKLWIAKIRFSKLISKSISPIPIQSHFDTQEFEFSAQNYPQGPNLDFRFKI